MPILRNSRHEKFAQLVANGKSATSAYIEAGYESGNAHVHGPQLVANSIVSARIAELKERAEKNADISRTEVLKFLARFMKFHPDIDNVRAADALKAVEIIVRMCGYNDSEKLEVGASSELTELLKKLRGS